MSKDNPDRNLVLRGDTFYIRTYIKGQLIQRSLHTSNVTAARKSRDKMLEEAANWAYSENSSVTWLKAVAEWIKFEGKYLPPATAKRYMVSLKTAERFLANMNIKAIDGKVIGEYVKIRRNHGVTGATIRRDLTAISRVLDYSISENWRDDNPTLSRRRLIKERRDPITLPLVEDVEAVISFSSKHFGYLIRAAMLTGCRQNELVTAQWRNYDPVRKSLTIIGKGNKRRCISLRPTAAHDALSFFESLERLPKCDYIFPRANGNPFEQAASEFAQVRRSTDLQLYKQGRSFHKFRYHDLRHLFAVDALKSGMGIYDLQQHLGHSSVKVTEMYLEHLTHEEKRSAIGVVRDYTQQLYFA